ncbi:pollen-specific leucine-rich repeat extensin-like protein 2 [Lycium barbarum]|uniref:pollen-specific leucine-rich repeat extensin-like protein 2 n=1 Tax=Lycium barbarum TaxID=112863 RepID=UPI00293F6404|nr:pollen-specific leucine-rich repeat extensin-like protein 2 [Lycium barbarum]
MESDLQEESEPQQEASETIEKEEPLEEEEPEEEEKESQDMEEEELELVGIEVEGEEEPFEKFPAFQEEENDVNDESDYYAPTDKGSDFYAPSPIMVPVASTMVSKNFGRAGPSEPACFTTTIPAYTALPSVRVSTPLTKHHQQTYQPSPQQNYCPPPNNPPQAYQTPKNYQNQPPPLAYNAPHLAFKRKPVREFTKVLELRARLFERLLSAGLIQKVPPKPAQLGNKFYRTDQTCAYHSGGNEHSIKDCINLKHKIQDLIGEREITLETAAPNVNTSPLPNHGNNRVHMIERDED